MVVTPIISTFSEGVTLAINLSSPLSGVDSYIFTLQTSAITQIAIRTRFYRLVIAISGAIDFASILIISRIL